TLDNIKAFDNLTKNRVTPVQEAFWPKGNEELAAIGVASCICHGYNTFLVKSQVTLFVLEFIARTTHAGTGWITALGHEILQHTMEGCPVVVALLCKEYEIVYRFRRLVREQLHHKLTTFGELDGCEIFLIYIDRHRRRGG